MVVADLKGDINCITTSIASGLGQWLAGQLYMATQSAQLNM
jgi:hypothetical protein